MHGFPSELRRDYNRAELRCGAVECDRIVWSQHGNALYVIRADTGEPLSASMEHRTVHHNEWLVGWTGGDGQSARTDISA